MHIAWLCITTRRRGFRHDVQGDLSKPERTPLDYLAVTFELQGRGRDDRSGRVGYHASRGDGVAVM